MPEILVAAQNNKGHPQVQGMEKFADLVKEKSGGKMTVKYAELDKARGMN